MAMNLKTLVFTAAAASALSVGALAVTAIPTAAHEVCDWEGDDCWESHPRYYGRDWDDWRRHEWHERREWEERRAREDYRRWYWSHRPYHYGYPGYGGGSVWFNF
ncbi:MAG TPA: hypothetical protein VJP60_05165 [Rhizomicrobium sp.]|nr:hypothetical protein [Rhizomicrobium sp.]